MTNFVVYLVVLVAAIVVVGSQAILCPKNQVWSNCPSACPRTCKRLSTVGPCIQVCRPAGCVCKKGFVLKGAECVPVADCMKDKRCPLPNQVWSECPSSCPRTCMKPRTEACIQVCRKPGCVCKPGHLLKGGKCVPEKEC